MARKNAEEARAFFHRVDADLSKNLGRLDSGAKALDTYERLRILHDFFRPGEEQFYKFDLTLHAPGAQLQKTTSPLTA